MPLLQRRDAVSVWNSYKEGAILKTEPKDAIKSPQETADGEWAVVWISWILALTVYVVGSILYLHCHHAAPTVNLGAFMPEYRGVVRPEPEERMLYVGGLLCIPSLPVLFYFCVSLGMSKFPRVVRWCGSSKAAILRDVLFVAGLLGWLWWLCFRSRFPNIEYYVIASFIFVGFIPWIFRLKSLRSPWILVGILAPSLVLSWYLLLCNDARLHSGFLVNHHYNLILGAVWQVVCGHTVLVDTTSQYGVLYPYIAAACMMPFGFSAWVLSQFFAAIGAAWYILVGLAVGKRTGCNSWSFILFFLALLGLMHPYTCAFFFNSSNSFWGNEAAAKGQTLYYQYFPLRVFWSGVFYWLMAQSKEKVAPWWLILGYCLAGVAFLWNLDTGLVILLAWSGTWALNSLAGWSRGMVRALGGVVLHAALCVLTATGAVALYMVFAKFRSGVFPDLSEFSRFQRIFYESGFFMLPMPLWEFWQPGIVLFATTVAWCVRKALRNEWDTDVRWLFFAAIYGLGIFSYYQGRSHVQGINVTFYPSLIVCFYWVTLGMKALQGVSFRMAWNQPQLRWVLLQILAYSLIVAFGFLNYMRQLPSSIGMAVALLKGKAQTADLFHSVCRDLRSDICDRKTVILGSPDAIVAMETECETVLPFSSITEVILQEQFDLVQQTIDRPDVEYVVVNNNNKHSPKWIQSLNFQKYLYYREVSCSENYSFVLFAKRLPEHSLKKWQPVNVKSEEPQSRNGVHGSMFKIESENCWQNNFSIVRSQKGNGLPTSLIRSLPGQCRTSFVLFPPRRDFCLRCFGRLFLSHLLENGIV
jgi:hypothetical protein